MNATEFRPVQSPLQSRSVSESTGSVKLTTDTPLGVVFTSVKGLCLLEETG